MKKKKRWYDYHFVPYLLPVLILILWQILGELEIISSTILPTPLAVCEAGIRLLKNGTLQANIIVSSKRALLGFLIGGSIGFTLGLLSGIWGLFESVVDATVQMVRTIPHLALIPLVILWFGIGEGAKIFLVGLGVLFPIYMNTYSGIKSVDSKLIEMGEVYGLSQLTLFQHIILPGALPSILVGIRYALGVMWTSLIVAETIGADSGIGFMATSAREFMQMDIVVLTIVIYAILGKLSDYLARLIEKRLLNWHVAYFQKSN